MPASSLTTTKGEFFSSSLCANFAFSQVHNHLPGDPDRRAPDAARGARQARRVRGHQGRHQVHQLQVAGLKIGPRSEYWNKLVIVHVFVQIFASEEACLFGMNYFPSSQQCSLTNI